MTRYLSPMVERNTAGEWVAWLHDGPTIGVYRDEATARSAVGLVPQPSAPTPIPPAWKVRSGA